MLAPGPPDLVRIVKQMQRDIRWLKARKTPTGSGGGPFMITHNFIIYGELFAGLYIPPARVDYDLDSATPETVEMVDTGHFQQTGTLGVSWELNGTTVTPSPGSPENVIDGSIIQPIITSGTALHGTFFYVLKHTPGF